MSRPVRLKMHNIRKALIEDCVQGNSGGAILRESNGQAIGLLTNGRDGTIVYLTADYLMEKIIELFNIGES
jgi:hypothetical protein